MQPQSRPSSSSSSRRRPGSSSSTRSASTGVGGKLRRSASFKSVSSNGSSYTAGTGASGHGSRKSSKRNLFGLDEEDEEEAAGASALSFLVASRSRSGRSMRSLFDKSGLLPAEYSQPDFVHFSRRNKGDVATQSLPSWKRKNHFFSPHPAMKAMPTPLNRAVDLQTRKTVTVETLAQEYWTEAAVARTESRGSLASSRRPGTSGSMRSSKRPSSRASSSSSRRRMLRSAQSSRSSRSMGSLLEDDADKEAKLSSYEAHVLQPTTIRIIQAAEVNGTLQHANPWLPRGYNNTVRCSKGYRRVKTQLDSRALKASQEKISAKRKELIVNKPPTTRPFTPNPQGNWLQRRYGGDFIISLESMDSAAAEPPLSPVRTSPRADATMLQMDSPATASVEA